MTRATRESRRLLLAGVLALAGTGSANCLAQAPTESRQAALNAALMAYVQSAGVPGATAAVSFLDGSAPLQASAGVSDVEQGTPMPPDARMPGGSIGKMFVAAAVVSLAQDKLLDLDARIATWFDSTSWFRGLPNREHVTVRMLLSHTSGIPDHVYAPAFVASVRQRLESPGGRDAVLQPDQLIAFVLDQEPLAPAGSAFHYSDTNYVLLGLIIEKVAGVPWGDVVTTRLLQPLQLTGTTVARSRMVGRLAAGYTDASQYGFPHKVATNGEFSFHPASEGAGGGLVTTAKDLALWGRALFGGQTIIGAGGRDLMMGGGPSAARGRYGLGVSESSGAHGRVLGHDGWFPGYRSKLAFFPDRGLVVAVQVNSDRDVDLSAAVGRIVSSLQSDLRPETDADAARAPCVNVGASGTWDTTLKLNDGSRVAAVLGISVTKESASAEFDSPMFATWTLQGALVNGRLTLRTVGPPRGPHASKILGIAGLAFDLAVEDSQLAGDMKLVLPSGEERPGAPVTGAARCRSSAGHEEQRP